MTLEEQFCFALYSATNAIIRTYRPLLRDIGLTYPQYLVLLVLWQNGEQTMGDVATRLAMLPGGLTPIIARLEAADLVVRWHDEGDRRVVYVGLTEAGAKLKTAVREVQHRVACATMLSEEDIAGLRGMLHALSEQLNRPAPSELLSEELLARETSPALP